MNMQTTAAALQNGETRTPLVSAVRAAQALARRNRAEAWAALNDVFRAARPSGSGTRVPGIDGDPGRAARPAWSGTPPEPPLNGRYRGEVVMLNIAPGLTQVANAIVSAWLPWKGKTFDAARARGDNLFTRDSLLLARVFWPLYGGYVGEDHETYQAFAFRTYVAPGLSDPDREVLKIDYDLRENPALSIRRVLDELVPIAPGVYLGKAHVKWWWGAWQLVAYFMLTA
jgi:hypothetical protein